MSSVGAIRAGRAFVELFADRGPLQRGLRQAERDLQAFSARAAKISAIGAAIGATIAAPLILATKSFIEYGDSLEKAAARTGVTVESLSELGYAAGQSGSGMEALEKGMRTLARVLADAEQGLSTAEDALGALGLTAKELRALSPEEQFLAVAEALAGIEDPSKRIAAALDVLGRSGAELLPLIAGGRAGIEDLRREARALGLTVSTDAAVNAAKLGDALDRVKSVSRALALQVGNALAPAITKAADAAAKLVPPIVRYVEQNPKLILGIAGAAAAALGVAAAFGTVAVAAAGLGLAVSGASALIGGAVAAVSFLATPVGVAAIAIGALAASAGGAAYAFLRLTETGRAAARDFSGLFGSAFADATGSARTFYDYVVTAFRSGRFETAAKIAALGIKTVFLNLFRELIANASLVAGQAIDRLFSVASFGASLPLRIAATLASAANPIAGSALRAAADGVSLSKVFGLFDPKGVENTTRIAASLLDSAEKSAEEARKLSEKFLKSGIQGPPEPGPFDRNRQDSLPPELNFDLPQITSAIEEAVSRIESAGSFSSAAAGINTAGGVMERTARAAEKTADNTTRIARAAESGGLSFE